MATTSFTISSSEPSLKTHSPPHSPVPLFFIFPKPTSKPKPSPQKTPVRASSGQVTAHLQISRLPHRSDHHPPATPPYCPSRLSSSDARLGPLPLTVSPPPAVRPPPPAARASALLPAPPTPVSAASVMPNHLRRSTVAQASRFPSSSHRSQSNPSLHGYQSRNQPWQPRFQSHDPYAILSRIIIGIPCKRVLQDLTLLDVMFVLQDNFLYTWNGIL